MTTSKISKIKLVEKEQFLQTLLECNLEWVSGTVRDTVIDSVISV